MNVPEFLDSNVLIYAYDVSDAKKKTIAQKLLLRAIGGDGVISSQVLAEFSAIMLHKMSPRPKPEAVMTALDILSTIRSVPQDAEVVHRAVEVHARYGVHFYDGMIIAAAERAGCQRIWSEDLNSNQQYFGIEVVNPFAASPDTSA